MHFLLFADANLPIMSLNDTWSRHGQDSHTQHYVARMLTVISVAVLRNLFLTNAVLLNERSPEQFEIIKHRNMRIMQWRHLEMCFPGPHCRSDWQDQMVTSSLLL